MLGTVTCALTFAYAQPKQEVKPYSLETCTEVYKTYSSLLKKVKKDKIMSYNEILNLYTYLEKHLSHMSKTELDLEVINTEKIIQEKHDSIGRREYESLMSGLEEILEWFPGLIKKDLDIDYPPTQQLNYDLSKKVKELIQNSHKFLTKKGHDSGLSSLVQKPQYTIQDLLIFYTVSKEKEDLYKKIKIETKKSKSSISSINLLEHKKAFENYLNDVEEWREKQQYKYISAGVAYYYYDQGRLTWEESRPSNKTDKNLEGALGCRLIPVVEKIPPKTMIPPWLGVILSLGGAAAMKGLITRYTRRKWDLGEGTELAFSSILGPFFLDILHPLVFPIRVFGIPVFTEFIRKFVPKENE